MEVFEVIKGRTSVRTFTNKQVSEEDVNKILDAAMWAPSAGNIQPWEFIVVRNIDTKRKLSEAAIHQIFIETAVVVIVVCADVSRSGKRYGDRGVNLYSVQDTAAATQNMLLAAYALKLGTCWVGAFQEESVSEALNLPREVRPIAIIPVGYPAEKLEIRTRRSLNEVVHHEKF